MRVNWVFIRMEAVVKEGSIVDVGSTRLMSEVNRGRSVRLTGEMFGACGKMEGGVFVDDRRGRCW